MKRLNISILYMLFLLTAICSPIFGQSDNGDEKYYSNYKKGIKPSIPKPYYDSTIASKSDNLIVELTGYVPDTTPVKDSSSHFTLTLAESPYYWGPALYYSWDPWYNPWINSWFYPGWGGSHWMLTYGWGTGPYWSFGYGWDWGYGYPWWHWDPYFNYGYFGGYLAFHPHYGPLPYSNGHRYLGDIRNTNSKSFRQNSSGRTNNGLNRGTVRRGGVDLTNGSRIRRGSLGKPQRYTSSNRQSTTTSRGDVNRTPSRFNSSSRTSSFSSSRNTSGRFDNNNQTSRQFNNTRSSSINSSSRTTSFNIGSRGSSSRGSGFSGSPRSSSPSRSGGSSRGGGRR